MLPRRRDQACRGIGMLPCPTAPPIYRPLSAAKITPFTVAVHTPCQRSGSLPATLDPMLMLKTWVPPLVIDVLLLAIFAALGRRSHAEGLDAAGILGTAAPFLLALVVFSCITVVWREPNRLWPQGVVLWIGTVALGLILRVLFGAAAAVPFIIVATIVLGIMLLGRRLVGTLLVRRKVRVGDTVN